MPKNSKIYLDSNIPIYLLDEEGFFTYEILKILRKYSESYISGISYVFIMQKGIKHPTLNYSLVDLYELTKQYVVCDLNDSILEKARIICKDNDFEDAVQVATALEYKIEVLLTADKNLAKKYSEYLQIILV